ncbi:polyphenol oxidase chloroplastic [Prunus yedoensis var. nudiflora]|uniref:Polyphenol oxidase chloroplastic n=1 Tax=Prunus yedoensis var. nudiflora TaxID=2094558 RepID=A0A314YKM6_PRUYE|nr:polyphenol oxidase chloroplastic [Prunus yedoensis var. nudiflora]
MATAPSPTTMGTYSSLISTNSFSTFLPNKSQLSLSGKSKHYVARRSSISCKATNNNNSNNQNEQQEESSRLLGKLDRRNILIGLGGLYGATTLDPKPFAFADPLAPPDLTKCTLAEITTGGETVACCPPVTTKIKTFKPDLSIPLRTRPAAQQVTDEYLAKFKKAQAAMRALPDDDPRSMVQQAKVHCAYCNGAYPQVGFPDIDIQVHFSWLFFPFHRMYLYFYERILGKLIGDPTFALPYWNWDSPDGFPIPDIYTDTSSPLYDQYRNADHQPPVLVDLGYGGTDDDVDDQTRIDENLAIMYRQMVSGAKTPDLFFGHEYRAGSTTTGKYAGTIENSPHNNIHLWVGDPNQTYKEDMGNFYSAGRDPVFYAHHCNVDRMWSIWKTLGGKRKDITDTDWLDAEFLFYDENAELVSCKVRDSLDTAKQLRYNYEPVSLPWLFTKPTARKTKNKTKAKVAATQLTSKFPATLDSKTTVEVARPKPRKRSKKEKVDEEEVLIIKDIEFEGNEAVKFDVFINDDAESLSRRDKSEFAGSFVHVPQGKTTKAKTKTNLKLGITDLLEDLGAEDDSSVLVTLVPRVSNSPITIGGFKIEYSS